MHELLGSGSLKELAVDFHGSEDNVDEVIVIAEIGCNHMGDEKRAFELIKAAKQCGASVAKFQKRDIDTQAQRKPRIYGAPHPNAWQSFGETYKDHRLALELSAYQHGKLKDWCEEIGIIYSSSVWDRPSAAEIIALQPSFIKVPSASNTDRALLEYLRDEYHGEVHVSTGMSTLSEIYSVVEIFQRMKQAEKRLVLYACTSGYPVPFKQTCLMEIDRLSSRFRYQLRGYGFSGHHKGIAIDNAAVALGARWIERHFTLDRTMKGTDHAASLEPQGLTKLVRDLGATVKSLSYKPNEMMEIERVQREKLKFREDES